jgi:N-acetyl-gamma-glutamyl-phosphate reductase
MDMVADVAAAGKVVIDFSADFRLRSRDCYEDYYEQHRQADLLPVAVYGLPELHREEIRKTDVIAVPGCYPTSAILGLAPIAAHGAISMEGIVVSSASGVSGMGRRAQLPAVFTECNEDARAYSIGNHRHTPEIEQEIGALAGREITVLFVPHLIPLTRGIVTTIYTSLVRPATSEELLGVYEQFYAGEPFVRVRGLSESVSPKPVAGTNFCDVSVRVDERTNRAIVLTALDNLGKGLSSAAVQCLNVRFGLPETMGLDAPPRWP